MPKGRMGSLLKRPGGTRFRRKRAAPRAVALKPSNLGSYARRVKSNIHDGGNLVALLTLGMALFKRRLLLLVGGGLYPESTRVKAKGEIVSGNDACARKTNSPLNYKNKRVNPMLPETWLISINRRVRGQNSPTAETSQAPSPGSAVLQSSKNNDLSRIYRFLAPHPDDRGFAF